MFKIFSETGNSFRGMHDDETVLFLVRRHWFTIVTKIFGIALAGLVPYIVSIFLAGIINDNGLWSLALFLTSIYYLVLWYGIFYALTMYSLNTWVVTNHRIIDSRQYGFFNREVSEVSLSKIQDVSTDIVGPIPTFLQYGDLEVQSAGAETKFKFEAIPNPEKIKEELIRLSGLYSPPSNTSTEHI
jgi:membrane protein YdbS with pleckstrin-like domain